MFLFLVFLWDGVELGEWGLGTRGTGFRVLEVLQSLAPRISVVLKVGTSGPGALDPKW